jgi:hypothetical protein
MSPRCEERMDEIDPALRKRISESGESRFRSSGIDDQMRLQRRESIMVRAAALGGRRWTMLLNRQSGRRLMRSSCSGSTIVIDRDCEKKR